MITKDSSNIGCDVLGFLGCLSSFVTSLQDDCAVRVERCSVGRLHAAMPHTNAGQWRARQQTKDSSNIPWDAMCLGFLGCLSSFVTTLQDDYKR